MILRFPYNSRWEPSGYREWVEWSSTQTFDLTTQYSHHFVEIQNKISNEFRVDLSQINNKNIWSKEGIISEIENLKLFRFCHHFSGQIESENKIVICLINPFLGDHVIEEYLHLKRGNFQDYWNCERNKFIEVRNQSQNIKKRGIHYKICKFSKNFLNQSQKEESWDFLHQHTVQLNLLPFYSSTSSLNLNKGNCTILSSYLDQLLTVFNDFLPSPRIILFIGKLYWELLEKKGNFREIKPFQWESKRGLESLRLSIVEIGNGLYGLILRDFAKFSRFIPNNEWRNFSLNIRNINENISELIGKTSKQGKLF